MVKEDYEYFNKSITSWRKVKDCNDIIGKYQGNMWFG